MLGRRQEFNLQLHQLLDGLLLIAAFCLAHSLRWHMTEWFEVTLPIRPFREFLWILAVLVPLVPIVLEIQGFYDHPLRKTLFQSLRQLFQAFLWAGVVIGIGTMYFKQVADSRAVLLLFTFNAVSLLLAKEFLLKAILRRRIQAGDLQIRAVLAGSAEDIEQLWRDLDETDRQQMNVVARVDLSIEPIERLQELFREKNVERVVFAAEHMHFHLVEKAVRTCETEGVEAWLSTEFLKTEQAKPSFDSLGGQPMLVFRMTPQDYWSLLAKGALDRVGALILIVLSSPFWIAAIIGIKRSSPGPVIFCQERGGRYGKPFKMFKFRTMCLDADSAEKRAEMEKANEQDGPAFKMENDPRVFKFGAFLRKTSIDELPQLVNVLRGEMSLVGPRPLPVYEVEKIAESAHRRRLSVKPGLTCLWQISGRSQITSFEQWVQLDLRYIDNWSLWLDLKILFQTIPAVIRGAGAQ